MALPAYMVLVYQNDNQCYYRLPGFSTQTYRDPNRSTDSTFMADPIRAQNTAPNSLPYELNIVGAVVPTAKITNSRQVLSSLRKPSNGASFVGFGELSTRPINPDTA